MNFVNLLLGILSVWRITRLLNAEDGPWNILARLRQAAGTKLLGQMLDCFYCLSLWVAVPFTLLVTSRWKEWLLVWPALSAGAILIEHLTAGKQSALQDFYVEDEEDQHVLR